VYQHDATSIALALRSFKLAQAIGRAIESYPKDLKIVVFGTGGMSHQLDGERAGFINKKFDLPCMDRIVNEPEVLTGYSIHELVRQAGAQEAEFILWLAMRGVLHPIHSSYHVAVSNTGTGLLVLENVA
jgi:protocatechuate 4,5-dioxygenase, beta chain